MSENKSSLFIAPKCSFDFTELSGKAHPLPTASGRIPILKTAGNWQPVQLDYSAVVENPMPDLHDMVERIFKNVPHDITIERGPFIEDVFPRGKNNLSRKMKKAWRHFRIKSGGHPQYTAQCCIIDVTESDGNINCELEAIEPFRQIEPKPEAMLSIVPDGERRHRLRTKHERRILNQWRHVARTFTTYNFYDSIQLYSC